MGYLTNYNLSVYSGRANKSGGYYDKLQDSTLWRIGCEIEKMEILSHVLKDTWETLDKWYEWESDMISLSKKFPDVLFRLHGEGEDNGALWNAYFLDGKVQYCPGVITYDKFDPAKLMEPN